MLGLVGSVVAKFGVAVDVPMRRTSGANGGERYSVVVVVVALGSTAGVAASAVPTGPETEKELLTTSSKSIGGTGPETQGS